MREAGYEMLIKFSDYYGVSIDYILYRTDIKQINR
jgi:Zn-dependent peptidase ImmA (M78 family)